ncbi:type II secretion system protein [Lentibacillus sp. JNUCC-1]|uniref:type II secretion system protein n=1 Tax=Lentibacillus sp. JNUCC-1 TaxID=2654513 RepID=UPI0018D26159|nr:type II secretion system protein [Lentibacillus sp. JNUCC-1]
MKQYNGFTFTETLVAFSIVLMLVTTALPVVSLLKRERSNLDIRLAVGNLLHDELQQHIFIPQEADFTPYNRNMQNKSITFSFKPTNQYIEGCATWINERQKEEKVCLYGYVPQ